MRIADADVARGRFWRCVEDADGRSARGIRDFGCGSAENAGTLFYVRREAGRCGGVEFASVRSGCGGEAGPRESGDGSRGRESKRAGGDVSGGATRDSRSGKKAAGESGPGCGRRRRDWLATFSAGGAQTSGPGSATEMRWRDDAVRCAGHGWIGDDVPWCKGRDRVGIGIERRKMGTRAAARRAFKQ